VSSRRPQEFRDSPNRFSSDFYCFVSRLAACERQYLGEREDYADDHEGARL
jgi:hypothetical protein